LAKKPFDHKVLSTIKCVDCGKPLKANLVHKLEEDVPKRCYECNLIRKGKK